MLPINLLRVRTRKGQIQPIYADIDQESLELATQLMKLFERNIDKKKGDLLEEVSNYENLGFDYRLVRGLSLVLQRLCTFQVEASVDPFLARKLIYEEASQKDFVGNPEKRRAIFQTVAAKLAVNEDELERSFQADLEDELVLKEFASISPAELLRRYNLSLTQTLLFRSAFIEIKVSDSWKEILREMKFRGLMYSAYTRDGAFRITVDGPLSLFRLTHRYGTSMAKVLPSIVQARKWEIHGSVVRVGQLGKRILHFSLNSTGIAGKIGLTRKPRERETVAFDSFVEKKFHRDFQSLNSGWELIREPTPLIAGKHVLIPDFSFEKRGLRVFMEIAGFWTQKYLETKIKKLQQLEGVEMIIAASEELACSKWRQIEGNVIFYKKKVPLKPILEILKEREEKLLHFEIRSLDIAKLSLEGDVVELQTIASKYGVSTEALRRKLEGFNVDGYALTGQTLISNKKLQEIDRKLGSLTDPRLSQAIRLIEEEGIDRPYDVLSTLNYSIHWNGLDVQSSLIYKK